jgi:hypothetical protein
MSFEITTSFVQQYSANVMMLVQQRGSRLRDTVTQENVVGKTAFFDQIGATEAQQVTNRHGDSPLVSTPHSRRKVDLADYDWGDLVDRLDMVRTLIDPTNAYAVNASWAMGRQIDDVIIAAYFASASTGETGGTSVAFPTSTNQIAVDDHTYDSTSGDVGLTISKLTLAREKLDANEVPEEEQRWIVHGAKQMSDMLGTTEVTSVDYNTVKALVRGDVDTFVGFTFRRSERLDTSSGDRRVPAYVASGMGVGVGKDVQAQIAPRADKRFSTYVYFCMALGATRIEEEKVIDILCNE